MNVRLEARLNDIVAKKVLVVTYNPQEHVLHLEIRMKAGEILTNVTINPCEANKLVEMIRTVHNLGQGFDRSQAELRMPEDCEAPPPMRL